MTYDPEVSLDDPSGRAVTLANGILPTGVKPINAMARDRRLDFPRNIDGATLWELQWAINKHRASPGKIAEIRASGSRTKSSEVRSVGSGKLDKQELANKDIDKLSINDRSGLVGWDDSSEIEEPKTIFEVADLVYRESDGDGMGVTIDALVRAYDHPEVVKHCVDGTEWVYEFYVTSADYAGLLRSKLAYNFAKTRNIIKDELKSRGVYDENDDEDIQQLKRIQGCLSTVGIVTSEGETHVDLKRRGTYRDVLNATRDNVLCRDIAIPEPLGGAKSSDKIWGDGIGYMSERWEAPLAV